MILINKSGDRVYLSNYRRMSFTRKGLKIADGFAEAGKLKTERQYNGQRNRTKI